MLLDSVRKQTNQNKQRYIIGHLPQFIGWEYITKIDDKKSVPQDLFDTLISIFSSEYVKVRKLVFFFNYIIRIIKLWMKMKIFHPDLLLFLFYTLAHKCKARLLHLIYTVYPLCFMGTVTLLPVLSFRPNSVHVVVPSWNLTFSYHHNHSPLNRCCCEWLTVEFIMCCLEISLVFLFHNIINMYLSCCPLSLPIFLEIFKHAL